MNIEVRFGVFVVLATTVVSAQDRSTLTAELKPLSRMESRTSDKTRDPGIFGDYWWANRFLSRHKEIEKLQGKTVDLVLIGDSITHFWEWKHPDSWRKLASGRCVLNLGYGGDCTQNVIWRINHGELKGYNAKCVVLMVGTNNNSSNDTKPENVAEAIEKIVAKIRHYQPKAQLVLHPIFPRGNSARSKNHAAARARNERTNVLLKKFAEEDGKILWIDFNNRLLDETGWVPKSIMADQIHPTSKGYDIWLEALAPIIGSNRPEISWSIMHPTAIDTNYMARVAAKAVEYGNVDSFEVCGDCHRGYSGINGLSMLERYPHAAAKIDRSAVERNRRDMNAICDIAHGIGKPLYYWHREIFIPDGLLDDLPQLLDSSGEFDLLGMAYQDWLRYKLDETFRFCPGLDGIVLTLTEADYSVIHNSNQKRHPPQKVVEKLVGLFVEEHESRGKRFILRSFGSNSQDYIDIIGGARRVAARHRFEIETKVTEADFVPWLSKNPFLKKNPPLTLGAECDALGEYLGAGYMPAAHVGRIRQYVESAREEGVDRYAVRIDRVGNSIFDSAHEINLFAYMRFIAEPMATEDMIVAEYAAKRFGSAAEEMIPLVKGELELVRNIHYVASNLVFHTFPLKADFMTVKAGGIFSVYRENRSLESAKDIWSILNWMKSPSHAQILEEKARGLAMAEAGLAKIESLKERLPVDEYARQHRAFTAAVKAAKALQAFTKCCVAYFEDMSAKHDDPVRLRRESDLASALIESLMENPADDFTGREDYFSVVGDNLDRVYFAGLRYYCRELLNEYVCERGLRRGYEARPDVIDFVTVGGIYDDNRTIRTMHGAYTKTLPGRVVRQAGNPIFPNGTISVKFRDVPNAKVEVALDPTGSREYDLRESVADGMRTVTVGKKGRDFPVLLAIALVHDPDTVSLP